MGASVRQDTENWPQIILDLRTKGRRLLRKEIADKVGVAENTISAYCSGQTPEPPYSVGKKLLQLHQRAMKMEAQAQR